MSIITLEQAKKHLNISEDFLEDNEYITDLIDVAENLIEMDIHKTIQSIEMSEGSIPPLLKHAVKLLICNFYENREDVIVGAVVNKIPISYRYLISKYKTYTIG